MFIQITEKYDGSNACATFNLEEGNMAAFSRKQELSFHNTLNGFWNYIQNLSIHTKKVFEGHPNYRVFGEWSNKNKIIYDDTNIKFSSRGCKFNFSDGKKTIEKQYSELTIEDEHISNKCFPIKTSSNVGNVSYNKINQMNLN